MWNSIVLIGVLTYINLIKGVNTDAELYINYALCGRIKLYTSIESLKCLELTISGCRTFGGSCVDHNAYKVV